MCGARDWQIGQHIVHGPRVPPRFNDPPSYPMFLVICNNCFFAAQFSAPAVMSAPPPPPAETVTDDGGTQAENA